MKDSTKTDIPQGIFSEKSIGMVVSEYHSEITFALRDACIATLIKAGFQEKYIHVAYSPGAFEIPLTALYLEEKYETRKYGITAKGYDAAKYFPEAIICLGCVIKGDSDHDVYINHAVADGLMKLSLEKKKPFLFGLLTTNTLQQAKDRAGGKHGNKGVECAVAALKMLELAQKLKK